ncbi:MAG: hypothetical protein JXA43_01085 [Candidatus Diapherotrites archaeon]|nr:hypothetical protein [Candidatus Diapherotrites archaeon]
MDNKIFMIGGGIIGVIVIIIVAMFALHICPPAGPWPSPPWCDYSQAASGQTTQADTAQTDATQETLNYLDEYNCFPKDCNLPPGMKELCENYKAGTISWPADCNDFSEQKCRDLCESEKAKPTVTKPVTFIVDVPENTPTEDDNLFIQIIPIANYSSFYTMSPMEQIDDFKWKVSVSLEPNQGIVHYRYFRNNFGDASREEILPEQGEVYREAFVKPGDTVYDKVNKWRWFPAVGEILPQVESLVSETDIITRISNEKFQRGYLYYDFWWDGSEDFVDPTNARMKEKNGNWVGIWPAWDYIESEPLPKLGYEGHSHVHTPEALDIHLSKTNESSLNILLGPQLCCHNPDAAKEYSDEWWEAWFDEMDRFSVYFAEEAEKNGIEYLVLFDESNMWRNPNAPADIKERYSAHIQKVREVYSGKLGLYFYTTNSYKEPDAVYPSLEEADIFSPAQFDFITVSMWGSLTDKNEPTADEIEANFRKIAEGGIKSLYDKYNKPIIIVSSAYPSVDGGLKGDIAWDTTGIQMWDEYSDAYTLDLEEQAIGHEGIMRVVAETSYIIGYYPFTYAYTTLPESKDWNIRGKPAEDIIAGWYAKFEQEGK